MHLTPVIRCGAVSRLPPTEPFPTSKAKFEVTINHGILANCPKNFKLSNTKPYFNKEICCLRGQYKSLVELCGKVNETTLGNKTVRVGDGSSSSCTCIDFMACKTVALTAVSSNHHSELQDAIASVQNFHPNMKIIVYNLGLHDCEVKHLNTMHNVEVVRFPFDQYPSHVSKVINYAWKILAINKTLQEHEIVFWMDSSVRLKAPFTDRVLHDLQAFPFRGTMVHPFYDAAVSYDSTYRWFGVTRRLMSRKSQVLGTMQFLRNSPFLHKRIYQEMIRCALDTECIDPLFSWPYCLRKAYYLEDEDDLPEEIPNSKCFRYDQSALTILIHREFNVTGNTHFVASLFYTLHIQREYTHCFIMYHS